MCCPTQTELNTVYVKYKILPNRQKRISNYYSRLFLGHSVPEMYSLVQSRLIADSNLLKDLQLPEETFVVSEPDLYYREDDFNAGELNICFILGHSGSGKSRMAGTLVGDDIDHIELDDLLLTKDHFSMEELKNYSDKRDSIPKEEYEDKVFVDFVDFAMDYAKQHREKKYIIDGIWIYLYFDDPSHFADYAVFIKGTSFLKSKIRAMKREMQRDKAALQDRKQMFGREVRNYLLDENKINSFRSYFSSSPLTIFREEVNDADRQAEAVRNALFAIEECFVNGDTDGIAEIRKKAEENAELSVWNKVRIFNECTSALTDSKLGERLAPV